MRRGLRALLLGLALLLPLAATRADAPALLLANVYRDGIDPAGYLVSEKLDGVRALWDGQRLVSRGGREIRAPAWFTAALPAQPLDGELWLGRGRFERLSGIVRREVPDDDEWREVRYMLFELPGAPGGFAERAAALRALVRAVNRPWLAEIEQFTVVDRAELQRRLQAVVAAGGEGLMLHRADAPYETGRSDALLKLKPWLDAEAVVVGHLPGKGKYAGRVGALRLRRPDGVEFDVGSGLSDAQRSDPPRPGTTVTYRYRALTARGLPRFATFVRVRED